MSSSPISVRFCGVRGSIAVGEQNFVRYGGDTICIAVQCGDRTLIFDAGSGIRSLGNQLVREGQTSFDLFFSHAHYDHVEGIPFFHPLFRPDCTVDVWSGHAGRNGATRRFFEGLLKQPYFPITSEVWSGDIRYHDFRQTEVLTLQDDLKLRTFALRHPGGATGYRIEYGGRAVCYITDNEHLPNGPDVALEDFIRGSDLMLYDCMYTDDEYPEYVGYGHSTWEEGVRLCRNANVAQLAAIHHRPLRDDDGFDALQLQLDKAMPGSVFARQGMVLTV
jgi:phosphoribosyl 1,2-cyclic phosphodiesterase